MMKFTGQYITLYASSNTHRRKLNGFIRAIEIADTTDTRKIISVVVVVTVAKVNRLSILEIIT